MKETTRFAGEEKPFEGDRTVRLKTLPAGARIIGARVKLIPSQRKEKITFDANGTGTWGATKQFAPGGRSVTVDFHARRLVSQLTTVGIPPNSPSNGNGNTTVQVDMGGIWLPLAEDGTIAGTDGANELKLSATTVHRIPQVMVQRVQLTVTGATETDDAIDLRSVTILSLPSNVTLRLGETPPFWARPGELATEVSSSDFAEVLQAFLAEAEVQNGFYDVPLVVHSDTIACLDVEVAVEFVSQQAVLSESGGETTFAFTHDGLPEAETDLLQIEVPAGSRIVAEQTSALVTGAFQPSRIVHGPTGAVAEPAAIPVTAGLSQAQPISVEETLAATAVDLRLELDPDSETATLSLNLLDDSDGKPANEPLLPAPVMIPLDRDKAGKPTWISVDLPSEFQFEQGKRYWLTLQALNGTVLWRADEAGAAAMGMHFTDNGGLSWRQTTAAELTGPAAGLFRLRHTPDRFRMPIELQVGAGDEARRVPLERFQPLGRVEFDLGFDEVAQAINSLVEEKSAASCPGGEHLANGAFELWASAGDGTPQRVDFRSASLPVALALASGGQQVYTIQLTLEQLGEGEVSAVAHLLAIDIRCHGISEEIELSIPPELGTVAVNESLASITLNADGSRAYVHLVARAHGELVASLLYVVDLELGENIGFFPLDVPGDDLPELLLTVSGLTVTPGGDRLYMLRASSADSQTVSIDVEAIDTDKLETAIRVDDEDATLESIRIDELAPIVIPEGREPTGLAISPDGARLFVTAATVDEEDGPEGSLYVFGTRTHQALQGSPLPVGAIPIYPTLSPDGRWIMVSNWEDDAVTLIDARVLTVLRSFALPRPDMESRFLPGSSALSPDGRLIYVASLGSPSIAIVDRNRPLPVKVFQAEEGERSFMGIVLTPDGDRLYAVASFSGGWVGRLLSMPVGLQLPEEWTLTSGSVSRQCYEESFSQAAILGLSSVTGKPEERRSALSQVVPVMGACAYDFTFWGLASTGGAVAEVIWIGDQCASLGVDQVPIETGNLLSVPETPPPEHVYFVSAPPPSPDPLLRHQRRLTAPEGATQAEIRFTTPSETVAAIDGVSLLGTREAIANSGLRTDQSGEVAGWSEPLGAGPGVIITESDAEVTLRNPATRPASLLQTISVPAGQSFNLAFHGRLESQTAAGVEVKWLAEDGSAVGQATRLEIPADGADRHAAAGTVPDDASEAEISLVIPGGATLTVEEVSLRPAEVIKVPITFVAQAPGELSVSDIRVGFEEAARPAPAVPESGLCAPTPPGRVPGEADDSHYCPCCGGDHPLVDPQPTATPAGRPAVSGTCPNCGVELVQPGGRAGEAQRVTRPVTAVRRDSRGRRLRPQAATMEAPEPPPVIDLEPALEDLLPARPMTPRNWAAMAGVPAEPRLPSLMAIDGIAEARAERLGEIGIEDLGMLATADADAVAEAVTGVSVEMAEGMIAEAQERVAAAEPTVAPLVTCIMATYDRPRFVPQAIKYFLRQDYPQRELIIVDDGSEPIGDLVPEDARIHVIRLSEKHNVGPKQNLAIEEAEGEIIAVWDDDVWLDHRRLSYQVASLLRHQADICGLDNLLHYDAVSNTAWHSVRPPGDRPWMPGSTLCFTRSYWRQNRFPDVKIGEDIRFIRSDPAASVHAQRATTFHVDILHGANISGKSTTSPLWRPYPLAEIQKLMGEDWAFYAELHESLVSITGSA